jgi:ATP-dependent Clp protease ATP-binding subunit ClpA
MEKHNVSRLIGAPPGYVGYEEGGQLTEKIRRRPYSVVLLDEIEKAHPDVWNSLLQIMEEGRLTDSFGRQIDFKNAIIIMTTNIGAGEIITSRPFGLGQYAKTDAEASYVDMKKKLKAEMEKVFRPEFLNRVDDIIVFRPLSMDEIEHIVELQLQRLERLLADRKLTLEVTPEAKRVLAEEGFDPTFGARPLKRAIQRLIQNPLALAVLEGRFSDGDHIVVSRAPSGTLTFERTEAGAAAAR